MPMTQNQIQILVSVPGAPAAYDPAAVVTQVHACLTANSADNAGVQTILGNAGVSAALIPMVANQVVAFWAIPAPRRGPGPGPGPAPIIPAAPRKKRWLWVLAALAVLIVGWSFTGMWPLNYDETEAPADTATEAPAEAPADTATEAPAEAPAEASAEVIEGEMVAEIRAELAVNHAVDDGQDRTIQRLEGKITGVVSSFSLSSPEDVETPALAPPTKVQDCLDAGDVVTAFECCLELEVCLQTKCRMAVRAASL